MCHPEGYGFFAVLGLKTGIHFVHFGLESGMVFEGTTVAYERLFQMNTEKERVIYEIECKVDSIS